MIIIAPLSRPGAFRAPLVSLSVRSGRVCQEAACIPGTRASLNSPPRKTLRGIVRAAMVVAVLLACSAAIPSEAQAHQAAFLERGCMVMTTALGDAVNPGLIIGSIEALIIPAGIIGAGLFIYSRPAWVVFQRKQKEKVFKENPDTPEAQAYFARKQEIEQRRDAAKPTMQAGRAPGRKRQAKAASFFSRNLKP